MKRKVFLGTNILFLRRSGSITQRQLADYLGKGHSIIGTYENGKSEPPLKILLKISEFFSVSVEDLLFRDLARHWGGIRRRLNYLNSIKTSINDRKLEMQELKRKRVTANQSAITKLFEDQLADYELLHQYLIHLLEIRSDGEKFRAFKPVTSS